MAERTVAVSEPGPAGQPDHPPGAEGRRMAADIVVVLSGFLLAGVAAGVLWPQLVDPVTVTRTDAGLATDEVALARRFGNDAWYAILGAAGGLVLGVLLMALRRTHEVVTLLVIVAGALLAALVSARLGQWLGPDDPDRALAGAPVGATAAEQVRVTADAAYLAWPVAALLGALGVLWGPPRVPWPPAGSPADSPAGRRPGPPERRRRR